MKNTIKTILKRLYNRLYNLILLTIYDVLLLIYTIVRIISGFVYTIIGMVIESFTNKLGDIYADEARITKEEMMEVFEKTKSKLNSLLS